MGDLRNVVAGDPCPDGKGTLKIARGIEVGHVFHWAATIQRRPWAPRCWTNLAKHRPCIMGCYGIGVTRIVAAAIEQNHDERGIIWPDATSRPSTSRSCPSTWRNPRNSRPRRRSSTGNCRTPAMKCSWTTGTLRPGPMFADAELIGIPHRLVLSDRGLDAGTVEYKGRRDADNQRHPRGAISWPS